jgi:G3E family GTPase
VFAASATVALGGAPVMAREANGPAMRVRYGKSGNDAREPAPDLAAMRLRLAWGQVPGNLSHDLDGFQESLFWQEGEPVPPHMADELFFTAHHMGDFKSVDKTILGVDDRPQFIVLTGFLGSGKTTFLKHFLEYQEQMNRFAAVIQNEIGETGLDGKILDREFAVTEIDEGCVCCSLSGNVKVAVSQIMDSFHPDVIVLETTGLANPANLLDEMEELDELIRFDSVTCVVDAASVEDCLREYKVAREQIAAADIILLNKADLAGEKSLSRLEHVIGGINPKAPLVRAVDADVNPALLYGADPLETKPRPTRELPAGLAARPHTHAGDGLESVKIDLPDPLDKDELIKRLGGLPSTVFRVKGVVELLGHETPAVLQYVAGRFELSEHRAQQAVDPFLVFIGQGLGQNDWAAYLAGCDQQTVGAP